MRAISESRLFVEKQDSKSEAKNPCYWGVLDFFLRISLIKNTGLKNALDVRLENIELEFDHLPESFNNVRVLFMTDLHFDGSEALTDNLFKIVGEIDYDYCFLGGDYTYGRNTKSKRAYSQLVRLADLLTSKSKVFGILGNYDLYRTAELLEQHSVVMLINEGVSIKRNGDKIYLAGTDDPSHYEADNIKLTDSNSWNDAFKIMLCHSPVRYKESAQEGYALYLTGDTHGGQICLPGGHVVFCGPTANRKTARGKWSHQGMTGYTSRGIGTSRIRVRYYCPPEITVLTLKSRP